MTSLYLNHCPLFADMTSTDIENCLMCSRSEVVSYGREEIIFHQQDVPKKLYVLLEGSVAVCSDSVSGKRSIVTSFNRPGEMFGEVFLFLSQTEYGHYAQTAEPAKILEMPKEFLYHTCGKSCGYHTKLISNMLTILAQKAYYLNQKLQIMSCATLRQKIAKILLKHSAPDGQVSLPMNREEMADFLNAARPSLSRELMKMQEDGLLRIDKRKIFLTNIEELQNLL